MITNNQLIPSPEEAKIIQWIFNEALKKIKPSVIAGKLNRSGIKTKNNCYFEGRTIKYILKNESSEVLNAKFAVESNFAQTNFNEKDFEAFVIEACQRHYKYLQKQKMKEAR